MQIRLDLTQIKHVRCDVIKLKFGKNYSLFAPDSLCWSEPWYILHAFEMRAFENCCHASKAQVTGRSHLSRVPHALMWANMTLWARSCPSVALSATLLHKIGGRIMRSSVRLSMRPWLITFESVGRLSWHSAGRSCHWRWPRRHNFWFRSFNYSKMVNVQTSVVNEDEVRDET
jgi:hypothetical protein